MTPRARIVRAGAAPAEPLWKAGPSEAQWRRLSREELEAGARAGALVKAAEAQAASVVSSAKQEAAASLAQTIQDARETADADLAARWLALRQRELHGLDGGSERVVALAVVLAERLLGASLELDPTRIASLARAVFAEARGARRAKVDAHPLDAQILREQLTTAGLDMQSIEIREDPALGRGELRLQTDLGNIDARLAPRFERLAAALRDALF